MGVALATTACSLSVIKLNPFPTGAAGGLGTKKGVRTEVVTESRNETGIGTEKILMVGKVQERPEDTENAPGVETGTRNGQGPAKWSGTETDTADLASVSLQALLCVSLSDMFTLLQFPQYTNVLNHIPIVYLSYWP